MYLVRHIGSHRPHVESSVSPPLLHVRTTVQRRAQIFYVIRSITSFVSSRYFLLTSRHGRAHKMVENDANRPTCATPSAHHQTYTLSSESPACHANGPYTNPRLQKLPTLQTPATSKFGSYDFIPGSSTGYDTHSSPVSCSPVLTSLDASRRRIGRVSRGRQSRAREKSRHVEQ
jgi:hypothetical protein